MLSIGELARRTKTKVQTIRYYEQIGLLRAPQRSQGGQRRYVEPDIDRLVFIRHVRALGFPLDAVFELLDLADHPERSGEGADGIAQKHLVDIEHRIQGLQALREELSRMLGVSSKTRAEGTAFTRMGGAGRWSAFERESR